MDFGNRKQSRSLWQTLAGVGLFFLAFGGKLKFLLPLLKLGKAGGTIWSMILTMGAYALLYPWSFAVGIVLMIFVHEMGHLIAARQKRLPVSAPSFIPFIGALVTLKKAPQDAATEAYVALGGPVLGTLGALLCLYLAGSFDSSLLFLIAWFGFFINLINLLPIHPLDGGRIVTAISRKLWLVGLVGGLAVVVWLGSILFFMIWAFFAWQMFAAYRTRKGGGDTERTTTIEQKVSVSRFYESGVPIPGEVHWRDLPFLFYSRLDSRETYLELYYPGIGPLREQPFPWGSVTRVELKGSRQKLKDEQVLLKLRVTYLPDERLRSIREESYYQVPPRQRWMYGTVYFGLAALLGLLLYFTSPMMPQI